MTTDKRQSNPDLRYPMWGLLALDAYVRVALWGLAFFAATWLLNAINWWPAHHPIRADLATVWHWARVAVHWILAFNVAYLVALIVLRLLVPTPREGRYPTRGRRPSVQVLFSGLIGVLTRARLDAPFPAMLVFHLANLPPLVWLFGPLFGPRSRSVQFTEAWILDPHLVTIGRNVVIGLNTIVSGHWQDRDAVEFRPVVIEDEALIGGGVIVMGGVRVGRGAMIGASALVMPNTQIGPNEFWAGAPARKIRDLPNLTEPPADTGSTAA